MLEIAWFNDKFTSMFNIRGSDITVALNHATFSALDPSNVRR